MKNITFKLTLTFSDKISDDNELREIAENIIRAIQTEANNGIGISPEDSDAITENVRVSSDILNIDVDDNIY